jgi:hypothetical protein
MTQPIPNPFGTDLATIMQPDGSIDLDPGMSEVGGRAALIQRCCRRITTPRGSVIDSPNDCVDIRAFVRAGVLASTPTNLQIQLQKEFAKEQGVISAAVGVNYNMQTSTLTVTINLTSSYGPLSLTFMLTAGNIALLVDGLPVNFNAASV